MSKTSIEWTDMTWNPVRGCSRVSEGCRNCYAERTAARFALPADLAMAHPSRQKDGPFHGFVQSANGHPQWTGKVELVEKHLDDPLHWKTPQRVFVNSMSDLFHEALTDEAIDRVFTVMAIATQHTFQILTKRPERMLHVMTRVIQTQKFWPMPNVWLGVSVEDQKTADDRIPLLLQTPAAVRFVSYEPALGPVDFTPWLDGQEDHGVDLSRLVGSKVGCCVGYTPPLDWLIVGGESGPGARPMHPGWVRSARDQCQAASVAFFFKQWGGWAPDRAGGFHRFDDGTKVYHVGKKAAGALLDGKEWREFPEASA